MNKRQLGTVYEQKAAAYLQQQGYEERNDCKVAVARIHELLTKIGI